MKRDQAEIICMNCGRTLGEVERRQGRFHLVQSERPVLLRVIEGRMMCRHCGGRGFIEGRLLASA